MAWFTTLLQKLKFVEPSTMTAESKATLPKSPTHNTEKDRRALDRLKRLDKLLKKRSAQEKQRPKQSKILSEEEEALRVKNPFTGQ